MSVTFGTSPVPVSHYAFTCGHDNGVTAHEFPTFEAAFGVLEAEYAEHGGTGHLAVCGDEYCKALLVSVHAVEIDPAPSLNVSNSNAARVLMELRLYDHSSELMGSSAPDRFLTRVERASTSGSRFEPGMDFYLPRLAEIAAAAKDRGLEVQWA